MALERNLANWIIEVMDAIDEKDGLPCKDPNWYPNEEFVITCVKHYRKAVNYRRLKAKKDSQAVKALQKLDPETRAELMRELGL
jgi:hypothetical protein